MSGSVAECNLHCSNGGNCVTSFLEKADTIVGAITFLKVKSVRYCVPLANCFTPGVLANKYVAGLIASWFNVFAP